MSLYTSAHLTWSFSSSVKIIFTRVTLQLLFYIIIVNSSGFLSAERLPCADMQLFTLVKSLHCQNTMTKLEYIINPLTLELSPATPYDTHTVNLQQFK